MGLSLGWPKTGLSADLCTNITLLHPPYPDLNPASVPAIYQPLTYEFLTKIHLALDVGQPANLEVSPPRNGSQTIEACILQHAVFPLRETDVPFQRLPQLKAVKSRLVAAQSIMGSEQGQSISNEENLSAEK